jgi:hypothetical protein
MKKLCLLFLLACALTLSSCYVATIDTGRTPSTKTIKNSWASCWIYGLVPPKTVMTSTECPNGVAKVETQHSFLNQLVGGLTFGLYTPIQITVTCAEESRSSLIGDEIPLAYNASEPDVRDAFERAARQSIRSGEPVYVRFTF